MSVQGFLELLSRYLSSTYCAWNEHIYLQKSGIPIGSCLAPILSDIFLASTDRTLASILPSSSVIRTFRYVDDYLVVINSHKQAFHSDLQNILHTFTSTMFPLIVTHEVPVDSTIRFLDIKLEFQVHHISWNHVIRNRRFITIQHIRN